MPSRQRQQWPDIRYNPWRDTALTLHLWTQIVGKVRTALTPWLNHSWHVPLYVSARGLTTSLIAFSDGLLEMEFDFISHHLVCRTAQGDMRSIKLEPQTVADFHRKVTQALLELGVDVVINGTPNEVESPIPFAQDLTHKSYDAEAAHRFWRALLIIDPIFKLFRTAFVGKASPVHFFWGSFDLAVTRFSGRTAPPHPGGIPALPDEIAREAYSHELSSVGFWPGDHRYPHAAFYSYAYPEPQGFSDRPMPSGATYHNELKEFVLPYETVRNAVDGQQSLLDFLQASYVAAAELGRWDRDNLECPTGVPGLPRVLS